MEGRYGRAEGVDNIMEEVFIHFHDFFKERNYERPIPKNIMLNILSEGNVEWLEIPFLEEEIKEAVLDCDGNKSPDLMVF